MKRGKTDEKSRCVGGGCVRLHDDHPGICGSVPGVKDKSGKCKLEVFKAEKGQILAGPFDSKEEGTKALHEKCPEAAKKPAEKKPDKK
jgi:hypothetical protein